MVDPATPGSPMRLSGTICRTMAKSVGDWVIVPGPTVLDEHAAAQVVGQGAAA